MGPTCFIVGAAGYPVAMPLTAAQYKTEFEAQLNTGETYAGTSKPEVGVAYAQIGSVYAYLYAEKTKLDDAAITPSAAANAYATEAESALTNAKNSLPAWSPAPAKAVAWAQLASTWAYAFIEQAKFDA